MEQQHLKNILIVEDDQYSAFISEKKLENYFNVNVVTNGYEALEAVERAKFDAILMDINLGDQYMDGLRTMRQIKQQHKHRRIKIFALTAFSDAREWYIKQGFDDLMLKPLDDEKVRHVINKNMVAYVKGVSLFRNTPERVEAQTEA